MKKLLIFIIVLFGCTIVSAQVNDNLDYFPHHIGDVWQYVSYPDGDFYEMKITRIDTTENGKWHFLFYNDENFATYKINTDSAIVFAYLIDTSVWFLYYRLNATEGEWWKRINDWWTQYAGITNDLRWNIDIELKKYYQYDIMPPDTVPPFVGPVEFLAKNIGYYGFDYEGGYQELIGCIIDGKEYGTLVNVTHENHDLEPNLFALKNYPNPFNGQTIISYSLPTESFVSLKIYDLLGREVITLFTGYRIEGTYIKIWTPKNISSGIYIAVLNTKTQILAKKIQYLK